jgi:hypothetical protein
MADEPWDLTKSAPGPSSPPPTGGTGSAVPAGTPRTGAQAPGEGAIRASDEDRTRTVEWLCWAAGDGQLTLEEVDGRLSAAYGARTIGELSALTSDLQPRPVEAPPEPERGLGDRIREHIPPVMPLLVPLLLLLFVTTAVATHGRVLFPVFLITILFVARARHRNHHRSHHHHSHHHHHYRGHRELPPTGWRGSRGPGPWAPPGRRDI